MSSALAAVMLSLLGDLLSEHFLLPRTLAPTAKPLLLASLDIHDEISIVHSQQISFQHIRMYDVLMP
jgi:hypothetical protein